MNPNVVIANTGGLSTHGNDLSAEPGSTAVADNVTFSRERLPELRRGFKDFSDNLPDFAPEQLIVGSNGTDRYAFIDSGIWYYDGAEWQRKTGEDLSVLAVNIAGMWVDTTETYAYVADASLAAIFRVTLDTGDVVLVAGLPGTAGTTSGTGPAARFNEPRGMWGDGTNLYVADHGNFAIRKIVIATRAVSDFAGTSGSSGTTNNTGTAARFQSPNGIWSDGTNLFVSESDHGRVRKIVISSAVVTNLATGLTNPKGLWIGPGESTLYVATADSGNVRTVDTSTGVDAPFASGLLGDGGGGTGTVRALMHSDGTYLWVATGATLNGAGKFTHAARVAIDGAVVDNGVFSTMGLQVNTAAVWAFTGKLWLGGINAPLLVAYPSTGSAFRLLSNSSSAARSSGRAAGVLVGPD